jgi:hypothetical protein
MRAKFSVGEDVWVPSSALPRDEPFALVSRTVRGQDERSVLVDDMDGGVVKISSRLVHPKTLGFVVLRLGEMATETTLLDPLAKSVLQYLRLLIPDDAVTSLHVRTASEIRHFMADRGAGVSHVVVVGHGSPTALKLMGNDEWLSVEEFTGLLSLGETPKTVVSLACSTGRTTFGRTISSSDSCSEFVAPIAAAHGASASLFVQYLLHSHLLHGHEFHTSAKQANSSTEGTTFHHWRNGERVQRPPSRVVPDNH